MATFLDVSSLSHFTSIFVFVFVMVVVYAMLTVLHVFGDNKIIYAIISFLMAIFVVMSNLAVKIVASTAPFLAVVFLFVVFLNIGMKSIGTDIEALQSFKVIFFVIVILVVLVSAGIQLRDNVESKEGTLSKSMGLLFNSKFIGMILLFAIA